MVSMACTMCETWALSAAPVPTTASLMARGASMHEYAPRAIKLAVVGTGAADKAQVSHMVQAMLTIGQPTTADVSDALAVALCHGQAQRAALRLIAGLRQ